MGSIGELTWIEYISKQTKFPVEEVKKRIRVQHWKDQIEVFDLGIFVLLLEAENAHVLKLSGLGITYERPQKGVEPEASLNDRVEIYTYDHYYRVILLAEYADRFSIIDSSGNPVKLSDREKEMYTQNRDQFLSASKLR